MDWVDRGTPKTLRQALENALDECNAPHSCADIFIKHINEWVRNKVQKFCGLSKEPEKWIQFCDENFGGGNDKSRRS